MRIKILPNGPYLVTGGVPLREVVIANASPRQNKLNAGRVFPQSQEYHLCRCGQSKNAPFCDGAHASSHFDGAEVASKAPYRNRVISQTKGKSMVLLDDGRCAYARFCHRDSGTVWTNTANDSDSYNREEALTAAHECPSGRLVMFDYEGHMMEQSDSPEILIVQDPAKQCSAGIWVKGPIEIEAEDGTLYEVRNRVALCRCGSSRNKPFCDANHITVHYHDQSQHHYF